LPNPSETVQKALSLLFIFSERQPTAGLSEASRLGGFNKATTLRYLTALQSRGFVELDQDTKTYRLGPAFLRFASLREAHVPQSAAVQDILETLARSTGETAHASVFSGGVLTNIAQVESSRTNRVRIDPGETLPLHATASGLAFLAVAPVALCAAVLDGPLPGLTPQTITDFAGLRRTLEQARAQGFAVAEQSYDEDVIGIAAPYFDAGGEVRGAIAVAAPSARMTADLRNTIACEIRKAADQMTRAQGGLPQDSTSSQ
jgi:DNA-binding IclR family transcriptional regulator